MPELPEVETVVRSIEPFIVGRTIREAQLTSHRVTRGDRQATAAAVTGAYIRSIRRHGKQIFLELDCGHLYIHLGMTGNLLWNAGAGKYSRAIFELDEGTLIYNDIRQFGRVEFFRELPPSLSKVGPDALLVGFGGFFERLKKRKGPIKPLLLNQSFISGVGNIYADEALYAAHIHPKTQALRISKERARLLYEELVSILKAAIEHRGSSISNHMDACGEPGSFQQMHSVYGRTGEPCLSCGKPLRRIVLGQRGTHYCARCQRA